MTVSTAAARTGKGQRSRTKRSAAADPLTTGRIAFAVESIAKSGRLQGARTRRLSARVDPGLIEAAKAATGIDNDSDLINAALAVIAAPDDFGAWLVSQAGTLPPDFEIDF